LVYEIQSKSLYGSIRLILFRGSSYDRLEPRLKERKTMYFIYDTKTKIYRGWGETKKEAELLLKELSHKWYYRYLIIK